MIGALIAAALAAAQAPPPAAPPAPTALVQGNRRFTLDLYREVAREKRGNIFLSPVSVALALGPVTAGARGDTQAAIGRALSYPQAGEALHPALGSLQRGLERAGPHATISIANALWLGRDFTPLPPFLETARTHYGAAVEALDFGGDPGGAAARINRWANEETRGRIPHVISPESLGPATRLIVTNAVYFLADWDNPFPPSSRPAPFTLANRSRVDVPTMAQTARFRHFDGDGFAALDLPYRDERLVMTVLLPDGADGLPALERALTPARLDRTLAALDRAEPAFVDLTLPRLSFSAGYSLLGPLRRLGMGLAFTPRADFGGISAAPLAISGVSQFTFLRVDEEGTEAAAVTVTDIMITGSRTRRRPVVFHADHPFLFMLRDRESGAILFFGRIVRP
jgi:serpin B